MRRVTSRALPEVYVDANTTLVGFIFKEKSFIQQELHHMKLLGLQRLKKGHIMHHSSEPCLLPVIALPRSATLSGWLRSLRRPSTWPTSKQTQLPAPAVWLAMDSKKTHFLCLRGTFACHYMEIAARPNQKCFYLFIYPTLGPDMKRGQPPTAVEGTVRQSWRCAGYGLFLMKDQGLHRKW